MSEPNLSTGAETIDLAKVQVLLDALASGGDSTGAETIDPAKVQVLLDALASGGDGNEILQSLAGGSLPPAASLIASLLKKDAAGMDDTGSYDEDADEIERLLAIAESDTFGPEDASDEEDDELEALREVNDTLAAALGACPHCWGGNPGCETCGGQGATGAMDPDEKLFAELILPAVRRFGATRRPRNPARKKNEHSPA